MSQKQKMLKTLETRRMQPAQTPQTPQTRTVWMIGVPITIALVAGVWSTAGHAQSSLKAGAYTDAQAARGKALYQSQCVTCHLESLNGTPPLAGAAFRAKWATLTVNDLYTKMKETMPTTEPGMLEPKEYVDLVAFILKENKLPAGQAELTEDAAALKALALSDLPQP